MASRSDISLIREVDANEIIKSYTEILESLYSKRTCHVEDVNKQLSEEIEIGSSSPAVNKSPGLRKWRRRPRDVVKKTDSDLNSRQYGDLTVSPVHKAAVNEVSSLNWGNTVLSDDHQRNGGIGPGKKARGFKIEKENSDFTTGSDSQSSNFVFVKYNEESSEDACYADKHLNEEARIAFMKSDAESDDVSLAADDDIEKHEGSMDQDELVESVKGLHFAQVGLETEVQKWRDVGKDGPLIFDDPLHEILELKDSKILELESILNSGEIKTKLEDRLMKLIQTEVEYVVLTTTTKTLIEDPLREIIKHDDLQHKNVSSQEKLDEKLQTKDLKKLQNKACKFTSCFIIMLTLLFVTICLQFSPQNVQVVPT